MDNETLLEQAAQVEALLPQLMRRLFTLHPENPAADLSLAQMRLCSVLQAGPRTLSMVSEELGISVSAITQLADRLERAHIVERVTSVEDRRIKNLQLTPQGAEMMCSRRVLRTRQVAAALEPLSLEAREQILTALRTFLEAARAAGQEYAVDATLGARLEL